MQLEPFWCAYVVIVVLGAYVVTVVLGAYVVTVVLGAYVVTVVLGAYVVTVVLVFLITLVSYCISVYLELKNRSFYYSWVTKVVSASHKNSGRDLCGLASR